MGGVTGIEEQQLGAGNASVERARVLCRHDAVALAVHDERGAANSGQFLVGNDDSAGLHEGLLSLYIHAWQAAPVRLSVQARQFLLPLFGQWLFQQPVADGGYVFLVDGWLSAHGSQRLYAPGIECSQQQADDRSIAERKYQHPLDCQQIEQSNQVCRVIPVEG